MKKVVAIQKRIFNVGLLSDVIPYDTFLRRFGKIFENQDWVDCQSTHPGCLCGIHRVLSWREKGRMQAQPKIASRV